MLDLEDAPFELFVIDIGRLGPWRGLSSLLLTISRKD
jgi:hypothetical protein